MAEDGQLLVEPYMENAWHREELYSSRPYRELRIPEPLLDRDLMTELIIEEIRYNHYLEAVSVYSLSNANKISAALVDNVSIRRFWYSGSQVNYRFITGENLNFDFLSIEHIEDMKLASFRTRVSLAVFLRGTGSRYNCSIARHFLEYLIGPGPLIGGLISKYLLK